MGGRRVCAWGCRVGEGDDEEGGDGAGGGGEDQEAGGGWEDGRERERGSWWMKIAGMGTCIMMRDNRLAYMKTSFSVLNQAGHEAPRLIPIYLVIRDNVC